MMPEFGSDEFLTQVEWFRGREVLFNSYLISITALMQGMDVHFYRTPNEAGTSNKLFLPKYDDPLFYRISTKDKTIFMAGSHFDRENPTAIQLQHNKSVLKAMLSKAGINTPFGGVASSTQKDILKSLAKAGVDRVTVKPAQGKMSQGVQLYQTLEEAEAILDANPSIVYIVEQHIDGVEFRITASKTEVIAAALVIPAHLKGDGKTTLKDLLAAEGEARSKNPANRSRPIDPQAIAKSAMVHGIDGTTVLPEGHVFRYTLDNMPYSAFRVPVLDRLPQNIKDCAIQTVRTVDAAFFTMDIFADRGGIPYVVDIDGSCATSKECFPYPDGNWNLDVPRYILQHHFPKHIDQERNIKKYDFLGLRAELLREDRQTKGVNAADFVEFA